MPLKSKKIQSRAPRVEREKNTKNDKLRPEKG